LLLIVPVIAAVPSTSLSFEVSEMAVRFKMFGVLKTLSEVVDGSDSGQVSAGFSAPGDTVQTVKDSVGQRPESVRLEESSVAGSENVSDGKQEKVKDSVGQRPESVRLEESSVAGSENVSDGKQDSAGHGVVENDSEVRSILPN
jgi:hypothetical protein